MKKNTPKNLSPKDEKMTYDCGGALVDMSFLYKESGDNEGLKQYRKEMRDNGYALSGGCWVSKYCV